MVDFRRANLRERYNHTQIGYFAIAGLIAAAVLVGFFLAGKGFNSSTIAALVAMVILIIMFSSLTLIIREDYLEMRFGFSPIRKRLNYMK